MRRLYVPLRQEEMDALKSISERERRQPPMQASVLLSEAIRATSHGETVSVEAIRDEAARRKEVIDDRAA
jgi:hypothetical protein